MPFKSRKAKGGKYCKLYENINKILSFFFSFKISNKIITWREIVLGFSLNLLLLVFVHTSSPVLAKNKKTKAQLQRGKSDRAYSGSQKRGWRLIITRQYPPLTHIQLISAHSSRDVEPKVGSQVKMLQDWLTHFGWQWSQLDRFFEFFRYLSCLEWVMVTHRFLNASILKKLLKWS